MYPTIYYAKGALVEEQLARKIEIGCDGIEYQLIPADFSRDYRVCHSSYSVTPFLKIAIS